MFILQLNNRIINSIIAIIGKKLIALTKDKTEAIIKNIAEYGNTSAASIPMALYDARKQLKPGDKIILSD